MKIFRHHVASLVTGGVLLAAAAMAPAKELGALLVTGGHWYDPAALNGALEAVPGMTYDQLDLVDEAELFDDIEKLEEYDAIIFYSMTQELSEERHRNFRELLQRGGVGIVAFHHGMLSWSLTPDVGEIFGIQFPEAGPFGFEINQRFWYEIADPDHPITAGMADFEISDEAWINFYGEGAPGNEILVATKNPGSDPPVLWLRNEGPTRVVSLQGGHDAGALNDPNFRELLSRSIYWAADMSDEYFEARMDEIFPQIALYEMGMDRSPLADAEMLARVAGVRENVENALRSRTVALLEAEDTTEDGRDFALRLLGRLGGMEAVEAAAEWLGNERFSHLARAVLVNSGSDAARDALLDALDETEGARRTGVITSLGQMRSEEAVDRLQALAVGEDAEAAAAAVEALATIGTDAAVQALETAAVEAPAVSAATVELARVRAAEVMTRDGNRSAAVRILLDVYENAGIPEAGRAALAGLVDVDPDQARPRVQELLASQSERDTETGLSSVLMLKDSESTAAFAKQAGELDLQTRARLLGILSDRDHPAVRKAATEAIDSEDKSLRLAAIRALGVSGDMNSAERLLAVAAGEEGELKEEARGSLSRIAGSGVNEMLKGKARSGEEAHAVEAMLALASRSAPDISSLLLEQAHSDSRDVRRAALDALELAATEEDVPLLTSALVSTESRSEIRSLERILRGIIEDLNDREAARAAFSEAVAGAPEDNRLALMRLLAAFGDEESAERLAQYAAEDAETRTEVIRAFADWPTAEVSDWLLETARSDPEERNRRLALRGYLNVQGRLAQAEPAVALENIQAARELATMAPEKQQLLSVLSAVTNPEAIAMASEYTADEDVADTAVITVAEMAVALWPENPELADRYFESLSEDALEDQSRTRLASVREEMRLLKEGSAGSWTFSEGTEGWEAANQVELSVANDALQVKTLGPDPFITYPASLNPGNYVVKTRMRLSGVENPIVYYWDTDQTAIGTTGTFVGVDFNTQSDGWQEFETPITVQGKMNYFRIDPGAGDGQVEIDYVRIMKAQEG